MDFFRSLRNLEPQRLLAVKVVFGVGWLLILAFGLIAVVTRPGDEPWWRSLSGLLFALLIAPNVFLLLRLKPNEPRDR